MKKIDSKKQSSEKTDTPDEKPAVANDKKPQNAAVEAQPPTPQTPKTSSWRKHEEKMLEKQQQERQRQLHRQQELYGYTPFKAPPYPIYDQRSQTPRELGYGVEVGLPRPGTDMGMYKPVRYPSYSTLPRPDQLDVESLYGGHRPATMSDIYGAIDKTDLNRASSKMSRTFSVVDPVKFRPGSAMSGRVSENHFKVTNVTYGPHFPIVQERYVKEIVNWTGLNLCSYMQGSSILSPSSSYDPVYDARTISWVFLMIAFVMILICVGGVGCCLFFIWKNRTPEPKYRSRTWSPAQASYIV